MARRVSELGQSCGAPGASTSLNAQCGRRPSCSPMGEHVVTPTPTPTPTPRPIPDRSPFMRRTAVPGQTKRSWTEDVCELGSRDGRGGTGAERDSAEVTHNVDLGSVPEPVDLDVQRRLDELGADQRGSYTRPDHWPLFRAQISRFELRVQISTLQAPSSDLEARSSVIRAQCSELR